MLSVLIDAIRDWVLSLIAVITPYDTMPAIEELFELSNNKTFETKGFYESSDGNGGRYKITTTPTRGSRKLTLNGNIRYLCYLNNGKANYIEVCKLGVRAYPSNLAVDFDAMTKQNSYATLNTTVLSEIYNNDVTEEHIPNYGATFKFPSGRFVFENTIRLSKMGYCLQGDSIPNVFNPDRLSASNNTSGTELIFPFLENNTTAVLADSGSITDVTVMGNAQKYNITIDRNKTITAPNEIVAETIADDNGTPYHTYGIKTTNQGVIRNVWVSNFYHGLSCSEGSADNRVLLDIYVTRCHYGVSIGGDIKCKGIYEWGVHTALKMERALASVMQLRADSCIYGIEMNGVTGATLTDVDIDFCTKQLIVTSGNTVRNRFESIHGRCCTLKTYPKNESAPDIRDISDKTGYGLIRVNDGYFRDNFISVTHHGQSPIDGNENYRTPRILLTYDNTTAIVDKNVFEVPSIVIASSEDCLKNIQTVQSFTCKIVTPNDTYFLDGAKVITDLKKVATLPTASASYVNKQYIYTGNQTGLYKGGIYECQETLTDTYEWKLISVPIAAMKTVVADSADFADFKSKIALL